MTLPDAEATVMAWTIPDQAPRIERSGYVAAVDAYQVLEAAETDVYLSGYDASLRRHLAEGGLSASEAPGGPLVFIELTQRGLDLLNRWRSGEDGWFDNCLLVPATERYAVTHVFDPRSGDRLGHAFEVLPEALWAVASPEVDHVRITATPVPSAIATAIPDASTPPTATRTPSPTPPPLVDPAWPAVPLGPGEYPAAVAETVAVWPLVLGSSWTYRVTRHFDGAMWTTWTITERVVAATRRGQELMEVVLERTSDRPGSDEGTMWADPLPNPLIVRRDGVLHGKWRVEHSLSRAQALATPPPLGSGPSYDAPLVAMLRLPMAIAGRSKDKSPDGREPWQPVGRVDPVASTAGLFPACHAINHPLGAANGTFHWLCPGVGFARHEHSGCGYVSGGYRIFDLIDYTIPPLVAVE